MVTNTGFRGFAASAYMVIFALSLCGCILAAVPLIIHATRGSSTSTATVLINRDAATVYADAVKVIKQRGFSQIAKQDDAKVLCGRNQKGEERDSASDSGRAQ